MRRLVLGFLGVGVFFTNFYGIINIFASFPVVGPVCPYIYFQLESKGEIYLNKPSVKTPQPPYLTVEYCLVKFAFSKELIYRGKVEPIQDEIVKVWKDDALFKKYVELYPEAEPGYELKSFIKTHELSLILGLAGMILLGVMVNGWRKGKEEE